MATYNHTALIGNLTATPELKHTTGKGTAVTNFALAINRKFTAENGEKREVTTFVEITAWGRVAEIVCDYTKKGQPLFVEGYLDQQTWEQDGSTRSKLIVVATNVQLLTPAPKADEDPEPKAPTKGKRD